MIKVEVKSTDISRKTGNSQKSGKPYDIAEQEAWAHLPGEPYPVKISVTLPDDHLRDGQWQAYAIGAYELDLGRSLSVGRFGSLQVASRLVLKKLEGAASRAA